MKNRLTFSAIALLIITSLAFTLKTNKPSAPKGHWISLFDGKTLNGWHGYNQTGPVKSWDIEDGALVCLGTAKDAAGGDIVTDQKYANFELKWEWKVDKGSNSGVMYHVQEGPKWQSPYETGPEYQIIDDVTFPQHLEEWQKTGADYAMHIPNDQKVLKPVGEWNTSKIIFNKGHVEHWLNGKKIVEFTVWTDEWYKKIQACKWKEHPDYGLAKTGEIALQDHGDKAYYRNIWIKEL